MQPLYAKPQTAPVGIRWTKDEEGESPSDVYECTTSCGMRGTFVSTVISPYGNTGYNFLSYMFGVFHVVLWLAVLAMTSVSGFGVYELQKNGTEHTDGTDFAHDPTETTKTIGMLGAISTIVGVLCIVVFSALLTKTEYMKWYFVDLIIQFFTMYGLVCAYYVFYHAAEKPGSVAYGVSLATVLLYSYAQSLLYSCTATLAVAPGFPGASIVIIDAAGS